MLAGGDGGYVGVVGDWCADRAVHSVPAARQNMWCYVAAVQLKCCGEMVLCTTILRWLADVLLVGRLVAGLTIGRDFDTSYVAESATKMLQYIPEKQLSGAEIWLMPLF